MEKLAILDCGGQYTKVIDRRVRELGVKSDILPINVKEEELQEYQSIFHGRYYQNNLLYRPL